MRTLLFLIASLTMSAAYADDLVPTKLFEIELGQIYQFTEDGQLIGAPVERVTGIEDALREGIIVYFKPNKDYPGFDYVEWRGDTIRGLGSSFRLFMLPVVDGFSSFVDGFSLDEVQWEVVHINWTEYIDHGDLEAKNDAYNWVDEMCKSIAIDLDMEPTDESEYWSNGLRRCAFADGRRQMQVTSILGKRIELSYNLQVEEAKEERIETFRRKAEMEQSRPYE